MIQTNLSQKERSSVEDAAEAGGQWGVNGKTDGRGLPSAAVGRMERRGCISERLRGQNYRTLCFIGLHRRGQSGIPEWQPGLQLGLQSRW